MAFLPAALFALACTESVESQDIRTTGIYPEIEVTADGSGNSKVSVRLKVGGDDSNTFLELTGPDTLEATVGDDTKTLDASDDDTYVTTFPVDAEGTEFTVAFLRGDADEDAPASSVALPAPFALTLETTEASRGDDAVIGYSWDPAASGSLDWSIEGDCIQRDGGSTPDDGENTLASAIETFESDMDETCEVGLTLTRSERGSIDEAFTEGGSIVAKQVRTEGFTSTP